MYEKGGNMAWLWFQGLLKLGWVHMFFNPPCSTQNPSLLTCEWDLAKSGRRLCSLWHSAAQRNVWLSHTAALQVYICDHRGEVQMVTRTEKVFPGTALENNNVYDSQESTRRLENTWAGEALRGCPYLPLPRTHYRNTSPRAGAAPTASTQGGGIFWANHGKKGRVETGSWEFYVDVPLWSQRLWHLLVKCTDIPAEGHGWALWADTMQMWATLFVQLSHRQQRDKAMHHREYRCPGPLCMPCFLERPTPSHTPTGAHSAPTLHYVNPKGKAWAGCSLHGTFTIRSKQEKTKSHPLISLYKPILPTRQECAGHTQTEEPRGINFYYIEHGHPIAHLHLTLPTMEVKIKTRLHESHLCNWANVESHLLALHLAGHRAQMGYYQVDTCHFPHHHHNGLRNFRMWCRKFLDGIPCLEQRSWPLVFSDSNSNGRILVFPSGFKT